ncbi:MAG: NAD-dependent epimerase/dehydratase family protein [Candidatus Pacebacteria bacterium]|nr:NAD-dependent epimerase/dehydratase family protein [Candidatus Paceibacterota bacterium]
MKKILLTGVAGFIGSHLADQLVKTGAQVIGVDNLLTGNKNNLSQLQDRANFEFIQADVSNTPYHYLGQEISFDLILHLASPASPPRYQEHPVATYLVNSIGTHQLLQYLLATNPQGRFVFTSTSEVYGDPEKHPQSEDYWGNVNPNGLRSCYDEAKRLGETICGVHARDFELDVRIVRIFNTYGPRLDPDDGRVISNFVKQALAKQPLTIYGDGQQTRSYCYIDDLVSGILAVAQTQGLAGQTINLGNPDEYTILETASIIKKVCQQQGLLINDQLVYQDLPADDPSRRQPDITKARQLLNWQPQISFEQGVKKTLAWFKNNS